jgi:hypothetical protein
VIANFGIARNVAKPRETLIERADKALEEVDTLRIEVVPKRDLHQLRRYERLAGRR